MLTMGARELLIAAATMGTGSALSGSVTALHRVGRFGVRAAQVGLRAQRGAGMAGRATVGILAKAHQYARTSR